MYPSLYIDFGITASITPALQCTRGGATANYFNNAGVLVSASANTLRIGDGGLYVEPAATNLFPYSRDLTQFTKTGSGTISQTPSLDRSLKNVKVSSSSAGTTTLSYTISYTGTHTLSFYCSTLSGMRVTATFGTQTVNCSGSLTKYTLTASSPTVLQFEVVNITGFNLYAIIDAVQIEATAYSTTPIHTNGSSVTRNADVVFIDITQANANNWFSSTKGTFVVDAELSYLYDTQIFLNLKNTSTGGTDYMILGAKRVSSTEVNCGYSNSNFYTFFTSCDNPGLQFRVGTSYIDDEQLVSLVGRTPLSGTALTTSLDFSDINKLYLGCKDGTTSFMIGRIKRLGFYQQYSEQFDLNNLTNV